MNTMSEMLRTTNPEAVGLKPEDDRRVLYEGQIVFFHPRQGEGRAGRLRVPAIVTRVEDEDHIELVVLDDPPVCRTNVVRRTAQNPVNSWSFITRPDVEAVDKPDGYPTREEMYAAFCKHRDELDDTVAELRAALDAINKAPRKH
jgi:hypothetical protein